MFSLAFAAFLRIGEMTVSNQNTANVLKMESVQKRPDSKGIQLIFDNYKHSGERQVSVDIMNNGDYCCPVNALNKYINHMRAFRSIFLYCWPSGNPVKRTEFAEILQSTVKCVGLDPKQYTGHSFRIGAACYALSCGFSDAQMGEMGRWRSDAFKRYIRL